MSDYELHPDDPEFKLRPCPFCGSSRIQRARRIGFPVSTFCGDCQADGSSKLTGREADAAWNKRETKP